jgi:haloalkane dehalogenase
MTTRRIRWERRGADEHAAASFPDFPYQPRFHDVLGARMAIIDDGGGEQPPLVLLHGNPTWSYLWRKVIPIMAPERRVIAPDLIGHGRSDKPDIDYRLTDHIRYIDGLLDALRLDRVVLVLHDWGGSIGLDWARRHPDQVAGLVLTETRLRTYRSWNDVSPGARERFRALRDPSRGWQLTTVEDVFFRDTIPNGIPGLSQSELAAYRAPYDDPDSRRPLLRWVTELPIAGEPADVNTTVEQYLRWLRATPVPTLLATVTPGAIVDDDTARSLTSLPHVTRAHLGQGGHFVPDQHGTALGRAIRDWLDDQPAVSSFPASQT